MKPTTMQNEAQLRQLIKQVSAMAKIPVSEDTVQDIVSAVKKSGLNPSNMESLMKMMMKNNRSILAYEGIEHSESEPADAGLLFVLL